MTKIYGINGSPRRKNWNTYSLLESALKGAESDGAETELINLYDYTYKGCISCLACKRKNNQTNGICAYKDDLTPIFEKLKEADGIIFGTPVYYLTVTGQFKSFLERLCFPLNRYLKDDSRVLDKIIPTGIIYSMNFNEEQAKEYKIPQVLFSNKYALSLAYGDFEDLWVYDTYQFSDYSKYDCDVFDPNHKLKQKEEHFPIDLQNAYELGKRIAQKAVI
ncbi:flavodoxin family protein [bacterium]|nr:flavodoxin family protein [bacterium]